jgi:hypothetical protein
MVVLIVLLSGCATPGAGVGPSAPPGTSEVAGTWRGSYWQLGGVLYADDADCTLLIRDDATFTATCTRAHGANNIAKPSRWSGSVVLEGHRVVLDADGGPWPSLILTRSGGNTLYGVTLDPLVGATVALALQRESAGSAR